MNYNDILLFSCKAIVNMTPASQKNILTKKT